MAASVALVASANRALEMKLAAAGGGGSGGPNSRAQWRAQRLAQGQRPGRPTSAELMRPMERGRQRKAGAVAQARRDGR
jgi:hypothetical protein